MGGGDTQKRTFVFFIRVIRVTCRAACHAVAWAKAGSIGAGGSAVEFFSVNDAEGQEDE
jgi:hypothetical protein